MLQSASVCCGVVSVLTSGLGFCCGALCSAAGFCVFAAGRVRFAAGPAGPQVLLQALCFAAVCATDPCVLWERVFLLQDLCFRNESVYESAIAPLSRADFSMYCVLRQGTWFCCRAFCNLLRDPSLAARPWVCCGIVCSSAGLCVFLSDVAFSCASLRFSTRCWFLLRDPGF